MESRLDYILGIMGVTVEPLGEMDENTTGWEWPVAESRQQHAERVALLRPILYDVLHDMDTSLEQKSPEPRMDRQGKGRSEEHTSELQSRLHLVCRLLLEKKKQKI